MREYTRLSTEKKPVTYSPGVDLVRYYVMYLKNFPKLKDHTNPITELANRVRTKLKDQTDDLNKLYRQIGALLQYLQIMGSEVETWPKVYPLNIIGDLNRDKGTLGEIKEQVENLKVIKETNKRKLASGFITLEREYGPKIEEMANHIQSCEEASVKKIITHDEFPEELATELPHQLFEQDTVSI